MKEIHGKQHPSLSPKDFKFYLFLKKKRVKITITEVIIKLLQVPWKISVIP